MHPIAMLPAHVAGQLMGVCFDVDDTVTTHGVLDPAAYAALHRLKAQGLLLVAATGRPLGFAEVLARTWPIDAVVGENGAGFIARDGRVCLRHYWDSEMLRKAQRVTLDRIAARVAQAMPHVQVSSDQWARRCDLAFDIGEEASLTEDEIRRLTQVLAEEGARVTVSSIHAHAQLGAHDKATGIAWALATRCGLDAETVRGRFLFVGDSGNDAAAFAWFQHTAGVYNVNSHLPRLPTPPVYVADACYGAGFAEIADTVLSRRSTQ